MAHFRGIVQGDAGEASRLGKTFNGVVNGWNQGIEIQAFKVDGRDVFRILVTGGSNGSAYGKCIAAVRQTNEDSTEYEVEHFE